MGALLGADRVACGDLTCARVYCRSQCSLVLAQLQYAWQQMTLEGSPFKDDTTLSYVMEKVSSHSSLSSGSLSLSSDDDEQH